MKKKPKMATHTDWTTFNRKIRLDVPIHRVYNAWAQPDQITRWFLATCEYKGGKASSEPVKSGDIQLWTWHNYPNLQEVRIFDAKENAGIEFSFGDPMKVSIALSEEDGLTVLHLRQFRIPDDEVSRMNFHVGCRQAWSSWLMNLKAWLEHGIVLHDKELGERPDLFDFVNT